MLTFQESCLPKWMMSKGRGLFEVGFFMNRERRGRGGASAAAGAGQPEGLRRGFRNAMLVRMGG